MFYQDYRKYCKVTMENWKTSAFNLWADSSTHVVFYVDT